MEEDDSNGVEPNSDPIADSQYAIAFDEYRVGYVAEKHGVTDNAARALQIFEISQGVRCVSFVLDVTRATASKYNRELREAIHPDVVFPTTQAKPRFDIFGEWEGETYEQGVKDAKKSKAETQVTESAEQIDRKFREDFGLNKGASLDEISAELMHLGFDSNELEA